jgi:cytochrome c oxidase assembly protein subunit 15
LNDTLSYTGLAPASTPGLPAAPPHDRALHLLAILTAVATFPLIFMGGLVTSNHAGMSVPDWPNSYHYNMFLFPPRLWIGGILYEHTHRLMGSVVGFLSLALAGWAWRRELVRKPRLLPQYRNLQYLSLAVLGMVILQGVLGGLRVVLVNLDLAIVHACVAQAFFCLAAFMALVSSRWWSNTAPWSPSPHHRRLIVLAAVCVVAVFVQLLLGAMMRHHDAGLAIPDVPLAYGKLLPPLNNDQLQAINHTRAWDLNLDPVTLEQVWLNFAHRLWALVVTLLLTCLIAFVFRLSLRRSPLQPLALILGALLLAQLTLGVLTVIFRKPADVASAHVAVGALVLVTTWMIFVCAARLYLPRGAWRGRLRDNLPANASLASPQVQAYG